MVVKLRSAVGVALIWFATVAGVSATAWFAIDRAGRGITGGVVTSLPQVTLGTAVTTTPGSGLTRTDATPEPSATSELSATPEPSATRRPAATHEPSAPPTSAARSGATTPQDRTVSVAGGQVSVRCTGSTIQLRIAQPDNGWRVEVETSGAAQVAVSFRKGDDEGGSVTHVTAVCATGTPAFTVNNGS